jgi:hypothetical protein
MVNLSQVCASSRYQAQNKGELMKHATKALLLGLALFTALFAAGCPERTSVGEIEANPGRFQNKEVVVAGTVRDSYGISIPGTQVRGGAYKIDDGTGSIWIFTEDTVPTRGAQVGVRGIIGTGATWKGKNYGLGVYEKDRKFRKR